MRKIRSKQAPSADGAFVGERLAALRQKMGLTLTEMSQRTSVSVSNLSKIERGEVSPSFDIIMRVCGGIGIPVEQFVKPGPKTAVYGRKAVTRLGEAIAFSSAQYDYLAHSSELSYKNMVPLEMRVRARSKEEFDHWSQHDGEEYVYVIAGEIEVNTDHYAPFRLKQGESVYFDSGMEHVYVSTGRADAHVLSVSYSPHATSRTEIAGFLDPAARPDGTDPTGVDRKGRSPKRRLPGAA